MGKGSSPSGNTTTTTINPTQQAQLPFLQSGWGTAQDLYNRDPFQYAQPSNEQIRSYQDLYNIGGDISRGIVGNAQGAYNTAIGGGMGLGNSPAAPYFNQFAQGTTGPQQQFTGIGQQAQSTGGPGLNQLAASASGQYLNQNPYIAAAVKAAQDPVTRQYQTATAPQTDANFAGAGRYGSGALLGARGQNEQNLGKALGDISTQMYNADYGRERQLQDTAAQQYGVLRNQGLQLGLDAARQGLAGQQYGAGQLQQGYNTGNQAILSALGMTPQMLQNWYTPSQMQAQAQTALQGLQQKQIDAPYNALARELSMFGQPTSGSGSTTSPYFQNQTANALSALSGAGSLASSLGGGGSGGLGGLGGLFGGGAGAGIGAFGPELSGAAAESLLATAAPAAFIDASGGTALATLASAAPAAAAWIICTELQRQGKMPKKHWAVGVRVFDAYPEIAKRGYYVWAIPSVRHLRRRPDSLYSNLLGTVFRWRAENIAASAGLRGARRLWRGRAITVALAPVCLILGALVGPRDWEAVYRQEEAPQ